MVLKLWYADLRFYVLKKVEESNLLNYTFRIKKNDKEVLKLSGIRKGKKNHCAKLCQKIIRNEKETFQT